MKVKTVMEIQWKNDFEIRVRIEGGTAVISANRDGLLSLAEQLMTLAGEEPGSHIHYDEYNLEYVDGMKQ